MWLLIPTLIGCAPDDVIVTGTVYAAPTTSTPAAGGTITILDAEGEPFDDAPIGADGAFEVTAPRASDLFALVEADGSPPTTFAGSAGYDDFTAEPGTLFGFPDLDAWLADFAGCPGLGSGGVALGEVRFSDLRDPGTGGLPVAPNAIVKVALNGDDDDIVTACMLDDDGAYDPDAEEVGATARFLIPGLPAGSHQLRVGYAYGESGFDYSFYGMWVEEGAVVPWLPVTVTFLE